MTAFAPGSPAYEALIAERAELRAEVERQEDVIVRVVDERDALRADNERLRAANAGLQDALNRARGPEGELPDKVAAWLRTKGYEVRALEPKP